jgi:hypothetical protein
MISTQILKSIFGRKGKSSDPTSTPDSKLHNLASLNNDPSLNKLPFLFQKNLVASKLDLDGKTPNKYLDNPPT